MRTVKTLIAAAALLILAACGTNSSTFPEPTVTSVTPTEVTPGTEITIAGSSYYAVTGANNTRIEVCGITMSGTLVEPVTRSIMLSPGSTITAEVGSIITSSLPEEGLTEGMSDVRVIRPDGSAAVLENAVTCVVPNEEPEPEPELPVAPSITSFTAPETSVAGQATTFTWEISNPDNSNLTCTLNPGGETNTVTLEDCNSGEHEVTYEDTGEFATTLTVTDVYGQETTATHDITVVDAPPVITSFTGPQTALVSEVTTLTWAVTYEGSDDLTCTITESEGATPVDVTSDCAAGSTGVSYDTVGPVTATLTVSDESGNSITGTHELQVNNGLTPEITTFEATSPVTHRESVIFNWEVNNPQGDSLTCTFQPAAGAIPIALDDCDSGRHQHAYASPGEYKATLTVADEYSNTVARRATVLVNNPAAPVIDSFTSDSPVDKPAQVNETVTFEWEVNMHPDDYQKSMCAISYTSGSIQAAACHDTPFFTYEYSSPGEYTVRFSVTDEHGRTDIAETIVRIIDSSAPTGYLNGPSEIDANAAASFTWDFAYGGGLDDLTCAFNPGDGSATEPLNCLAGYSTHTYEWAGTYTATLTVQDETHPAVNLTHDTTVNATADAPIIDRWDAELEYHDPDGEEITAVFFVQGRNFDAESVTCSIGYGDNTSPLELGDACVDQTRHDIPYSNYGIGTYDASVTITDTHGNRVTETIEVNVTSPTAPHIYGFGSNNNASDEWTVLFHWSLETDPGLNDSLITCTFDPGDNTDIRTCDTDDFNWFEYDYPNPGQYAATVTVHDGYNDEVTETLELDIEIAPPGKGNQLFLNYRYAPERP